MKINKISSLLIIFLFLSAVIVCNVFGEEKAAQTASPDSDVSYTHLRPEQRAEVARIDQEIQAANKDIDAVNHNLSRMTRDFYEMIGRLDDKKHSPHAPRTETTAPGSGQQIGIVIGLMGGARAEKDQEARDLKKDSFVYENEKIITGADSNVEIRFLDDTILSQGPESVLVLDQYLFRPGDADNSGLSFKFMQGAFRHVTGKIAEQNPKRIKLESPLSFVGIRGTTTVHKVTPEIESHGAEDISGGLDVLIEDRFDETRILARRMLMVDVPPDQPMTAERAMTEEELNFFHSFSPAALEAQSSADDTVDLQSLSREILARNEFIERMENKTQNLGRDRDKALSQSVGCFPADAIVLMEDGSTRRITDLRPGDMVMTYDIGYDTVDSRPVIEIYAFDSDHLYTINNHLMTTGGERLLTNSGWKEVNRLRVGEFVLMDQDMVEIININYKAVKLKVYNLHVADTHNFYVSTKDSGNYLVHNSCGGGGGGGGGAGK